MTEFDFAQDASVSRWTEPFDYSLPFGIRALEMFVLVPDLYIHLQRVLKRAEWCYCLDPSGGACKDYQ
jgi:hypothetical protein